MYYILKVFIYFLNILFMSIPHSDAQRAADLGSGFGIVPATSWQASSPMHHPLPSHILAPLHSQEYLHMPDPSQFSDSRTSQSLVYGLETL